MQISKNWHACSALVSLAWHRSFKIGILWSFSLCVFQTLFKSMGVLLCVGASVDDDDGGDGKGNGTAVVLLLVSLFVGIIWIRSNFGGAPLFVLVAFLAAKHVHFFGYQIKLKRIKEIISHKQYVRQPSMATFTWFRFSQTMDISVCSSHLIRFSAMFIIFSRLLVANAAKFKTINKFSDRSINWILGNSAK